ncbi:MAG: hypothetical protein LBH59_10590 [Planctomycetaceae bacterium]|nr:hypothetical protein [Planctomycetaceae bacterium]
MFRGEAYCPYRLRYIMSNFVLDGQILREYLQRFRADFNLIEGELGRLIVGQGDVIREIE